MKTIKFLAVAALLFVATSTSFAQQKFGAISSSDILSVMPEMDSAQVKMESYNKELEEMFVAMQNEYQTKAQDYQKKSATFSDVIRQQKEKELSQLGQSIEEFQRTVQEDMNKKQQELMAPIRQKVTDAIAKVGKAQGLLFVFDKAMPLYTNEALVMDVTPLVKTELKLK